MQQRPGLQQQDPNVNVMAPETHYANQHAYPQQYMNAQLRQHPPQIPLAMNKYSPQPQQHQMPMATPQQQQQQQQQPPVQKTPRPRIAAKIVDPATNKELNIADLASDKSNVTSNEVSKDTSAAAASNKSIGNTAEDSKPSIAVPSESNKPSVGSTSDATKPEPKQPVAAAEAKDSSSVTGSTITATATTNSSVAPESTTASNVQQVQKPAPTVIEHKTAEVKTAGGSVHPQSAKISKPAANAVSSQSHHHPQIESNSKSQPESVAVAKSQPDHNLAVSTAIETPMSKAASAAIAGKSTPINSSPPEAKSANVSPAYGRSSVTAATNASPILSSAKEPEVVETSKPEVQSNSAPSEAIGDQPTMNQLADSKGKRHTYTNIHKQTYH